MKTSIFLVILIIFFKSFGQTKPIIFYNENGEKITKQEFIETKNFEKNLDLYFENDTTLIAMLVTRQKFGYLDKETFSHLKSYLTELSGKQIDSTQNIVINYLTGYPKKENIGTTSNWSVLDKNYLRRLHKIANIQQFWINSPESDNLQHYHHNRINWIEDKNRFFEKTIFPYKVKYVNYVLIKPDGHYYYFLGEHGKNHIWEQAKKYFK